MALSSQAARRDLDNGQAVTVAQASDPKRALDLCWVEPHEAHLFEVTDLGPANPLKYSGGRKYQVKRRAHG